jgi:vitamin K-dependent gamma-carboxylase
MTPTRSAATESRERPSRNGLPVHLLFRPVDIAPLVFFRVAFGFLLFIECIGAIAIGFVHEAYIEPRFHFPYFGISWLTPLPGSGMIVLYVAMGLFALGIMLGYRYRAASALFLVGFTYGFLLEKAHYINHHYLVILLGFLMVFLPAHRYASLDVRRDPALKREAIPAWPVLLLASQIALVYLFAAFAKMNPDWLAAMPTKAWLGRKADYPVVGALFQMDVMPWLYAYVGLLFDLLIVPAMIWARTRKAAFAVAVVFHLLNLVTFQIGIFPFLAIAATALFFPPEAFRRVFFPEKEPVDGSEGRFRFRVSKPVVLFCLVWLVIQVALPLRPYFHDADTAWTEKGHRFAWRMMLRTKTGDLSYTVHFGDGSEEIVRPREYLTGKQAIAVSVDPEMMWQMAGFLKNHLEAEGRPVRAITANSRLSLNGRPFEEFVDPEYDLTAYDWRRCTVPPWVRPAPE